MHRYFVTLSCLVVGALPAQHDSPPPLPVPASAADPVLDTVRKAIRWIGPQAVPVGERTDAILFPGTEGGKRRGSAAVYGGNAGILLFLQNAAAVLRDPQVAELATKLTNGLLSERKQTAEGHVTWMHKGMREGAAALYMGDAGIGHAFLVRAQLTGDKAALQVAIEVGDSLIARGKRDGETLAWDRQVEVISGAAGTLLYLLELGAETKESRFVEAAHASARWLLAQAKSSSGKGADGNDRRLLSWRWAMGGNAPYVNFSHGTAGVAYALARVGRATSDAACLVAARDGTAWVDSLAKSDAGGTVWPVIDGRATTMGGWCHGPPGTARLHLLLHALTGEARYLENAIASARWVMAQAPEVAPGQPAPQFPPSLCCGVAGVVDFFCDLYRATGDAQFAAFARRAGDYLIAGAVADGDGVKWPQGASHNGTNNAFMLDLMLGTPGEALALLRLATLEQKVDPIRHLPDRAAHE
jgi:lantibiotic modifying enzyme